MSRGLVYHAGGLGDFVLSLPAIFRVVAGVPAGRWHYWGPTDRLCLLPGLHPAPPPLLREGHTLWGDTPAPRAREELRGCSYVLAFGGRMPPTFGSEERRAGMAVSGFPGPRGPWVPVHHARQLDESGVPRVCTPWLPGWRKAVCPGRRPEEVVFHPGSGDRKKNLAASVWREVLEALARQGKPVRLVLGPVERERGGWEEFAGAADSVTACEGLPDLLGAFARAALFLGNDSGPAHLGALLGIPTVSVFGPSDPRLWRPLGPKVGVVQTQAPCAPCSAGGPLECPEPRCLDGVTPAQILREALRLLG